MRYLGILFIIVFVSCSNLRNQAEETNNNPVESIGDSNSNPDSTFNNFILQFGFDSEFQIQRVIFPINIEKFGAKKALDKSTWINDRLFVDLEAITEVSNGLEVKEDSNERVFSWIETESGVHKNYYFKKQSGKWFLLKIEYVKNTFDRNKEDFYFFLGKFCKDSIFQKQRIHFPLDVTCLDDEYNEVKEKRSEEKWKIRGFYYNCDSIATLFYDFQRTFNDTDNRILLIRGVENGIDVKCTFKRINNHWMLIQYEDYST